MVARHLGPRAAAARFFNHGLEHAEHGLGDLLVNHLSRNRLAIQAYHRQLDILAVIGQHRVRVRQLHSSYREAIAVGQGSGLGLLPDAVVGQIADALAGEAQARILPQADLLHHGINRLSADIECHLADANVARLHQNLGKVEHATARHVTNGVTTDTQTAWRGVYGHFRGPATRAEGGSDGERFNGRTRLKHIDHCAVAHGGRLQVAAIVRVIGRLVDHGQHFAGLHIEQHQAAGFGTEFSHSIAQLAVCEVLQAQVNRQCQGLTGLGILSNLHVFDQPPAAILEYLALTGHASQPILEGQLHAFTATIINVGKAHYMGSHLTRWVEAAEFFNAIHARHFQVEDALPLLRRQPAHQVHELALVRSRQPCGKCFWVLPQSCRQSIPLGLTALQFLAIGPQGGHRGADSQGLAITVGNQTAMRWNRDMPHAARIAMGLQEALIKHL